MFDSLSAGGVFFGRTLGIMAAVVLLAVVLHLI